MLTLMQKTEPSSVRSPEPGDVFRVNGNHAAHPGLKLLQVRRNSYANEFLRAELRAADLDPAELVRFGYLLPPESGPEQLPLSPHDAVREILSEVGSKDVLRKLALGFEICERGASGFPLLKRCAVSFGDRDAFERAVCANLQPLLSPACLAFLVEKFLDAGTSQLAGRLMLSDLSKFDGKAAASAAPLLVEALNEELVSVCPVTEQETRRLRLHANAAVAFLKMISAIRPRRSWELFEAVERWRNHELEEVRDAAARAFFVCFLA